METQNWFIMGLLATVLYGTMNFLYKLAAQKGYQGTSLINSVALTVALFAGGFTFITHSSFGNLRLLLLFSLLNSSFFAIGLLAKYLALKSAPTSYVLPIGKLNVPITILLAIIFLQERLESLQWLGLFLALSMLFLINFDLKKSSIQTQPQLKKGILLALVCAVFTGGSIFVGKLAAGNVPIASYIFVSYLFVSLSTAIIHRFVLKLPFEKKSLKFGIPIGLLNLAGYSCILLAFKSGPLSIIQGIFSTSFIIPIFLSVLLLKESFNWRKGAIVLIAIIALLLFKS